MQLFLSSGMKPPNGILEKFVSEHINLYTVYTVGVTYMYIEKLALSRLDGLTTTHIYTTRWGHF